MARQYFAIAQNAGRLHFEETEQGAQLLILGGTIVVDAAKQLPQPERDDGLPPVQGPPSAAPVVARVSFCFYPPARVP